jgi:uncharacterized membrane protein
MPVFLQHAIDAWTSLYSNSAAWRTAVGFAHIGGLVVGGGAAIAADRATLKAWRRDSSDRLALLTALAGMHSTVIAGLVVVCASGLLLLAADLETYLDSRVFWSKMALVVLLAINGRLLMRAGHQARDGADRSWTPLVYGSVASLALWLCITLLGTGLPNV